MPIFPGNPLEKLAITPDVVDQTFDLGDMSVEEALAQVEQLIADGSAGRVYGLRFDPPKGDGTETLFQPLGRFLLQARRQGRLSRCLPAAEGNGYVIRLADK